MKANRTQIPEATMESLGLDPSQVGIKGSPTFVSKAFRPPIREAGEMITAADAKEAADVLVAKLKESKVLV
jgi:electron transfer flavoprotein beta subunit